MAWRATEIYKPCRCVIDPVKRPIGKQVKYAVITPVRDEGEFISRTINSVVGQTVRPARWIIVNDGSTDETGQIAEEAARSYTWITVVNRADRGFRKAGGGVVEAFYQGYRIIESESWDYLVKLDGDLSFAPDYFEKCFERFDEDRRLGIAGGTICSNAGGVIKAEAKKDPRFHVRGATKIYRWACWGDIEGLIRAPGWDTLDEVKANMLGWGTYTLSGVNAIHHRPTGAAYGAWNDRVKAGMANYISGYHPLFMLLKCVKRIVEKPYLVGGLGIFYGFVKGYVKRIPQVEDKAVIRYLRQQQISLLMGRKSLWDS
jgi:biofilm PGA synthesis N-glycosyltransferase PgaC